MEGLTTGCRERERIGPRSFFDMPRRHLRGDFGCYFNVAHTVSWTSVFDFMLSRKRHQGASEFAGIELAARKKRIHVDKNEVTGQTRKQKEK